MEACVHIRALLRDRGSSACQRYGDCPYLCVTVSVARVTWAKPHRNKRREKEERGQELTAEHETQKEQQEGANH